VRGGQACGNVTRMPTHGRSSTSRHLAVQATRHCRALSLLVAFALTVPVNHWMIGRGRGHAAVHDHGRGGG